MNAIIRIVKEMTSREKAHFRKYTEMHQRKRDKNYLKLYTSILAQPICDAESLRKHFKGTPIHAHFSSEMNYLFEQLMKALMIFHLNNRNSYKLLKLIFYIELLLEKGERKKAAKLLKQAKETAYQFEDFSLVIKTIELEERVLFKQGILNFGEKLESLEKERQLATDKINNFNRLRLLREQVREFQFTHIYVNSPEKYPEVFEHPLLAGESTALSKHALEVYYYTKCIIEYLQRNYEEGIVASRIYLSFLEEHEYLFPDAKLLPALSNYLLMLSLLGAKEEFELIMQKLYLLESKKSLDQHYIEYIRNCRSFELCYTLSDQKMAEETLTKAIFILTKQNEYLAEAQKDYLFYYAIRCCIDLRQFEKGFELMNLWYELGVEEFSTSLRRIFKLIIIYELGYVQWLETEIQTTYKVLKKRKKYARLEKTFIAFFRKFAANPTREKKLLYHLNVDLDLVSKSKEDNKYFGYINYCRWCEDRCKALGVKLDE